MKHYLPIWHIVLLWLCFACQAQAQTPTKYTTIIGEVYDNQTGQPIPNVNIVLGGTKYGTATNNEGMFYLSVPLTHKVTMNVSSVGYRTQHFSIEPGTSSGIDVALEEKTTQLGDLFVIPGSNPAHDLMAEVRNHRAENDLPVDSSAMDEQTRIYVSNIRASHLQKHLWQSLSDGLIQQQDSSYMLPLYQSSRVNNHRSSNAVALTATRYETLLDDLVRPVDFYQNLVSVYESSFISPLASDGNNYYNFYLVDSTRIDADSAKAYILHFRTKAAFYYTFNGTMTIDSASYALRSIEVQVPAMVNANYLQSLLIQQEFAPDHTLTSEHKSMLLDISSKIDTTHHFPTLLLTNDISRNGQPVFTDLDSIQDIAETTDSLLDILHNTPVMRTARFLAYSIQTGFIPTGSCIEVGNVSEIFRITPMELVRLGLPLRTNEKLWKNVSLEAYVAYGFGDHAWKGAGAVKVQLPSPRRNIFTLRYADEYIYSDMDYFDLLKRENAAWFRYMGLTTAFLRTFYHKDQTYNTAVRNREFTFTSENDWTDHLESTFRLSVGRMGYGEPSMNYYEQPSFRHASLAATFRLGWREKKVDLYFRRIHVYSSLPVLYLNGEIGSYQLDNQDYYSMYGKLRLMLRQQIQMGVMGQLDYMVEGGFIFGAVPYPLLKIFAATESFAYDSYRFSLMHNYRYAADEYLQMSLDWNGKGCLFNLIPGIRYLHLRELFTFKMAVGSLSEKHDEVLASPLINPDFSGGTQEQRINKVNVPFIELGCGIGNILRVGEVYSIWRITHRDDPIAPLWAIRFRFRLTQ